MKIFYNEKSEKVKIFNVIPTNSWAPVSFIQTLLLNEK